MNGKDVLGIIFANGDDDVISQLTGIRSMASVPFGGGYRLIDFALSNMVNAGVRKVGIVTNNNYQSLMDHIGTGKPWDLSRKNEGLFLLPPFNAQAVKNYNESRVGSIRNITPFLEKSKEDFVFMSDCTYVSNIDMEKVFEFAGKMNADMTLLYKKGTVSALRKQLVIDEPQNGCINEVSLGTPGEENRNCLLKAVVMRKSLLETLVNEAFSKGAHSFEMDVIIRAAASVKTAAFAVDGFCGIIDSVRSYFEANFALLDQNNYRSLFNSARPVYTKVYEDMPAVYGLSGNVKNSLISDGCIIDGKVENCILFRDCRIEKDAEVRNCILMPHTFVAEGAKLDWVIADKSVAVRSGKTLSGADTYPVFIGKGIHI